MMDRDQAVRNYQFRRNAPGLATVKAHRTKVAKTARKEKVLKLKGRSMKAKVIAKHFGV